MRILVDARGLLEEVKAGVEGYTLQMLANLKRIYPEDEYILFSYSWKKKPEKKLLAEYNWIHKKWPNILASLSWRILKWPRVDKMVGDIDWVWYPNIRFMPVGKRIKKVVTVHDLSFEVLPECYRTQSRWWHWYMNIQKNLQKTDLIMAVSKNTAKDVINIYGIEKEKVMYKHLGISPEIYTKKNIDQEKFLLNKYFLHIGTLEKRKNVDLLIDAYLLWKKKKLEAGMGIGEIPDLVLVGGEGWSMSKYLRETINSDSKINYLGYVDEEIKIGLIKNAGALIYVSHYEGFGFPPLEALALEVPVIAGFGGSLGEVLQDQVLIVDSLSVGQLIRAMDIVYDTNFKRDFGNGLKYIQDKYDWTKTAQFFRENLVRISG